MNTPIDLAKVVEKDIRNILGFSPRANENCNSIPMIMNDETVDRLLKVFLTLLTSIEYEMKQKKENLIPVECSDQVFYKTVGRNLGLSESIELINKIKEVIK